MAMLMLGAETQADTISDLVQSAAAKRAKGDLDGALIDYSQVIDLAPSAEAYYNRANIKSLKHDLKGAEKDYATAIKIKSDYAEAYNNRGLARQDLKDFKGAIEDFSKA